MTMPGGGQQVDSRDATVNLRSNVDGYVTGMGQAEAATNRTASAIDALDQKVSNLRKTAAHAFSSFAKWDFATLGVGVTTAATFDKQLGTLNATAAVTGQRFSGIKGAVTGAFADVPASRTSLIQLAETINSLGITAPRDIGKLLVVFSKLHEATGEDPGALAQGLLQLSRLMGQSDAAKIGNYANALLTVSKNAGVSATGVLSFAQAIAPMARQAGIGEAKVLGIAAAFTKAGADGFVAANTFNSIVGDITKDIQSGSPEIAKYANLIGKTAGEFKKMDKTTALQDIFRTIAKQGPAAINTLNRLGIDGVRAQAAVAAVVQSGDLDKNIALATGSSGDQKNLNKGAKAATDNLPDSLTKVRNILTQISTQIGETFVKPLKFAVDEVDHMFHALNAVIKPVSALLGGFAAIAGAVAGIAGGLTAIGHLVVSAALIRMVTQGAPRRAFREGMVTGRGGAGETASAAMYARHVSGEQRMPLRARIPFVVGQGVGSMRAPIDPNAPRGPGVVRQVVRGVVRAPAMLFTGVNRMNENLLKDAAKNDYARSLYTSGGTPLSSAPPRVFAAGSSGVITEETTARKGAIASMRMWTKEQVAANKVSLETESTLRAFTKVSLDAAKSVASLGIQSAKTATAMLTGGRVFGGRVAATEGAAAAGQRGVMSRMAGGIGRGLAAPGLLGYGMIAAMAVPSLMHRMSEKDNQGYKDVGSNSISKYDQLLDQTSTNLAKFSDAVKGAGDAASSVGNKTLSQVAKIGPEDRQKVAGTGYKTTDDNFARLAKTSKKDVGGAVSYIQTLAAQHGGMDPKTFDAIKDDLIHEYGDTQAQKILNAYMKSGTGPTPKINYGALGKTMGKVSRQGETGRFNNLSGQINSSIVSQAQVAAGPQSSKAELDALLQTYGEAIKTKHYGGNTDTIKQLRTILQKNFGGSKSDYGSVLTSTDNASGQNVRSYSDLGKNRTTILEAIGRTDQGKEFLKGAGLDPKDLTNMKGAGGKRVEAFLSSISGAQFPGAQASEVSRAVAKTGALGQFAINNKTVQGAVNQPDNPGSQYAGAQSLFTQAGGLDTKNVSTDKLNAAFDKLTGTIQDTTDPLYQLARAAKSYAAQQEQVQMATMSRRGQLATTSRDYLQAQFTQAHNPSQDSAGDLQTAKTNYDQQVQAQTQYEIQVGQQAKAFGVQMVRSEEDYGLQRAHQVRDFGIQMAQSEQDYQKSRLRSQRDFGIQMVQQQQDRNLQLYRQQRDHDIQMNNQAKQAAVTVYNPYARVQSSYTSDASTTNLNLVDQNQRLATQKKELDALKAAGLSIEAIQTLDLANPANAQQLDRFSMDVKSDASIIPMMNAQSAKRVKLTKALTQNNYNLSFQQTQQDFSRGIKDAAKDYETARDRAVAGQRRALGDMAVDFATQRQRSVEAQNRSLSDQATAFGIMVKRSKQDLKTQMTELYGSFADNYDKTLQAINNGIGKYAPDIAKKLVAELTAMKHDIDTAVGVAVSPVAPHRAAHTGRGGAVNGPGHAMGVISTVQHVATISEGNRPEMILPLDSRGQQFMAGMYQAVSRSVLQMMQAKGFASTPSGAGQQAGPTIIDSSTNFSGPIAIYEATNIKEIQRQLEAKARLARLSRPARAAQSNL